MGVPECVNAEEARATFRLPARSRGEFDSPPLAPPPLGGWTSPLVVDNTNDAGPAPETLLW